MLGSDKTWADATSAIAPIYGDFVPTSQDDIGTVLHAMLNRYRNVTNVFGIDGIPGTNDDDVYVNPIAPLASGLYVVNFETAWNEDPKNPIIIPNADHWIIARESQSNRSAVVKQGFALKQCIQHVLNATGATKVILVGHSMGGIAIREYLQRHQDGKPRWWIDPASSDGHRVAKVVTISSPHRGSDILKWIPKPKTQDEESPQVLSSLTTSCEAIRDLRITYATGSQRDGVYLFGGREAGLNTNWLLSGWHNADVDCNGRDNDVVEGINPGLTGKHPLPVNVRYTYIAARYGLLASDVLVDFDRQYLVAEDGAIWPKGCADTIQSVRDHWTVVSDIPQILRALDEPTSRSNAYEIRVGTVYRGAITTQPGGSINDIDVFKLALDTAKLSSSTLRLILSDTAVQNRNLTWTVSSTKGDTLKQLQTASATKQIITELDAKILAALGDTLYLSIAGQASGSDWKYPYEFTLDYVGRPSKAPVVKGLVDTTITHTDILLDAFSVDYDNANYLTWAVTSSDSTLIAPADISVVGNGSRYTAKLKPRPNAVGTVNIRLTCSDGVFTTIVDDYDITLIKDSVIREAPVIIGLRDATIKSSDTLVDEFTVAYDEVDSLTWNIVSLDTTVIPVSNISLLGEGSRIAIQAVPNPGTQGTVAIQVFCSDSVFSTMASFRITVVQDSLPRVAPRIAGVFDTTITTSDTLLQDIRVLYEDPEELQWTVTSLDSTVIPASNIVFINGGSSNVLRVIPRSGLTGTSSIRIVCRDSINTATAEMRVKVVEDTLTTVDGWNPFRGPAFSVYPMPVTNDNVSIMLRLPDEHAVEIAITDHIGRIVAIYPIRRDASQHSTHTINTTSMSAGRYHIQVRTNRGLHVAPFVVNR